MCWWCTSTSSSPSSTASVNGIVDCRNSVSEILILDELGDPFANASLDLNFGSGFHKATTDANGRIGLSSPVGTLVKVRVSNIHEMAAGDGTTTPSGHHFMLRATAP